MNHGNRGRLAVDTNGNWRLYTNGLAGWEMLGTVQQGLEIGALGKSSIGVYARINGFSIKTIGLKKVNAAIQTTVN